MDDATAKLIAAVRGGDVTALAALLDVMPALAAARLELAARERPSDEPAMTPLHLAVAEDQPEIARLLVARGAPLDARNGGGRTALHDCFELGREAIARLLRDAGAPLDACAAAAFGEHDALRDLLARDPAQVHDRTTGLTPLEWAGYAGDPVAAAILIDAGARVDDAWGPPCHVGAAPMLRLLLARGGDPNSADANGDAPLHLVLASRIVRDPTEAVRVLLAGGADPRRANRAGRTPLDVALEQAGQIAETYFPRRPQGEKRLDEAIRLLRAPPAPDLC